MKDLGWTAQTTPLSYSEWNDSIHWPRIKSTPEFQAQVKKNYGTYLKNFTANEIQEMMDKAYEDYVDGVDEYNVWAKNENETLHRNFYYKLTTPMSKQKYKKKFGL